MNVPPEVLTILGQWIERAEHDLTNAEHTLPDAVLGPHGGG